MQSRPFQPASILAGKPKDLPLWYHGALQWIAAQGRNDVSIEDCRIASLLQ
jgi:hypothetical protein